MTEYKDNTPRKAPSEEQIRKRITEMGFPVELAVSDLLRRQGYFTANSLYYIDKDEGKGREIDIRALKNFSFQVKQHELFVRHVLLIECKRSVKGRPWVIFTSPANSYDPQMRDLSPKYVRSDRWVDALAPIMRRVHPYYEPLRRGRAYAELFRENDETRGADPVYKALTTAVKATIAIKSSTFASGPGNATFYYPIVVFDGEVWECHLESGELRVGQTQSAIVSFFYESPSYPSEPHAVAVVCLSHFEHFVQGMDTVLETVGSHFQSNPDMIAHPTS